MSKQRKKLDSRIPAIIQNGVQTNHRSFFVIVGDRGRDQVVTLHYLLSKARVAARPNVLWCYKKELSFSSHRKKRMNQIKKEIARGTRDADEDDPFELFVSSTSIRYAYYKETDKILGNTYGMCILQDFEALTPNLLARTVETVEGGGIVVLLLKTMTSLKQLYSMTMDVHSRYRTEAHQDTIARFNERFILSLGGCDMCLVVDDELNVLPLSAGKNVKPLSRVQQEITKEQQELKELKESMKDTLPVGTLVNLTKTIDQAKAVLTFVEAIAEKTLKSTVTLTASRGRGKSAALGIAIASAVAYGYSNIFITSPSPENLKTLFEFIFKGFDGLGYQEHLDYDIIQSSNPAFQKAVVRVNIFKDHRQTIQWIQPSDHNVLAQAELLVIDEAAAIPLPVVKKLLGPYLVFMASTINGYEGTGRSLSLKLIKQLREQASGKSASDGTIVGRDGKEKASDSLSRSLREIKLEEPIRYSAGDSVETWLNKLLCLDCNNIKSRAAAVCPHPSTCDLYYVTRDTLFSYHPVSEAFLQKMMALYVASHYKNSPNDLQLLSDAPAHHLFVLLPQIDETKAVLPEPLCVVQICMEGQIARGSALASLSRGVRANGDLIPWVVSQQFQDDDFASLSGGRVVRIATHPDYIGMGYGQRALEQLEAYYNGEIQSLSETLPVTEEFNRVSEEELENATLATDQIKVRDPAKMPPLLLKLSERPLKEELQWLGVSYGITNQLHKFWKRSGYTPVYVRQTANDLTGEHTCIMLKTLKKKVIMENQEWLSEFSWDFRKRYIQLLSYQFSEFSTSLVLSVLGASNLSKNIHDQELPIDTVTKVERYLSPFDLKRLASYSQNLLDYHVILDLVPTIARFYFLNQLNVDENTAVKLSAVQGAILVGLGLQKKTVEQVEADLNISVSQILALFARAIKKVSIYFEKVIEQGVVDDVEQTVNAVKKDNRDLKVLGKDLDDDAQWDPSAVSLEDDLEEAGNEAMQAFKQKQRELIDGLDLKSFEIGGVDEDWKKVKPNGGSNVVAIANANSSKKRKAEQFKGTADQIADKAFNGGLNDSKGLVAKVKAKKHKKSKK
ncbi:N-acetyltransferase 10 [Terramyces sp. JEL0728]|nr:N-acetyltransferase 10 [Terramyces sp. JEL0728]